MSRIAGNYVIYVYGGKKNKQWYGSMLPLCTDWIHQTPYGGTLAGIFLSGHGCDADLFTRSISEMECLVHQIFF